MKFKELAPVAFGLVLIGALAVVWFAPAGANQAPNVTFQTISGKAVTMAELKGKPVLVNFWATTCPGCVKEMPHLAELYEELHPQGFEIVGVAMSYDPPNQVLELVKRRNVPYPIALDINDTAAKAFGDVQLTPTTFLIDPDGRIVQHKIGEMDLVALREKIVTML